MSQGLGDVALSGAARSCDEDGDLLGDEAARGQFGDKGLVDVEQFKIIPLLETEGGGD